MKQIELIGGEHAVLLLHGLQGSPTEVLPLAQRLNKAGYTVRVPHFTGYGYMPGETASVTRWQAWREAALEAFDELSCEYKSVSIGGLCIGAVLALSVAEKANDRISGLSLLSTTLFYDGWSIPWYRFLLPLGYYTPLRYTYAYREREPYGVKNAQLRRWIAREMAHKTSSIAGASQLTLPAIHEAERLIKSVRKHLSRVTVPTLVIHAEEDDVATPKSADFVVNHIGSDKVQKILLHDSYHMITLDNERERVAEETIKFFHDLNGLTTPADGVPGAALSAPHLSLVQAA